MSVSLPSAATACHLGVLEVEKYFIISMTGVILLIVNVGIPDSSNVLVSSADNWSLW